MSDRVLSDAELRAIAERAKPPKPGDLTASSPSRMRRCRIDIAALLSHITFLANVLADSREESRQWADGFRAGVEAAERKLRMAVVEYEDDMVSNAPWRPKDETLRNAADDVATLTPEGEIQRTREATRQI